MISQDTRVPRHRHALWRVRVSEIGALRPDVGRRRRGHGDGRSRPGDRSFRSFSPASSPSVAADDIRVNPGTAQRAASTFSPFLRGVYARDTVRRSP